MVCLDLKKPENPAILKLVDRTGKICATICILLQPHPVVSLSFVLHFVRI